MLKQENEKQLKQNAEQNAHILESILPDYGRYVNGDQADFLKSYLKSLQLDLETAMTRGDQTELQIIVEDISTLKKDAQERLESVKKC